MRITAFICFLIIFGVPSLSFGEQPLEALQRGIYKGISVLEEPEYKNNSRWRDQQQKLWEVTRQVFDFEEFSRRVLASNWKKFTPRQRKEFVNLFSEFLGKFYLSRLRERYRGERVVYLRQKMIGESKALVEIKVFRRDLEIPLNIRMTKHNGTWKAYDISAVGVSAVSSYRAQFKWILRNESPEQVIGKLKKKIEELDDTSN